MTKLLLCDTNALFFRSRSALLRTMGEFQTSTGIPTTGTFGVLNTLFATIEKGNYDCVVPCYDKGGNFRKKESDTYKSNRTSADSESPHWQDFALLIEEALPALGLSPVGVRNYEADDIIADLSRNAPYTEVHILSCDKDMLQLVNDKVSVILFSSAKKIRHVDREAVLDIFGVEPEEVPEFKALSGDASDNVAGIKGIGPVTAQKIIAESKTKIQEGFSLADSIVLHPKVSGNADIFLGNLRLVTLEKDVPDLTWYSSAAPRVEEVEALFTALEFNSMLKPSRLKKILKSLKVPANV